MQYFRNSGFPKNRLTLVKNKQRNFATYNMLNIAFNFCGEDDVFVRLDSDDEILGRNFFGALNAIYIENP